MTSKISISAFTLLVSTLMLSQVQPLGMAVRDITLSFDQLDGTNGSAVAYNEQKGLYYIAIAGNATYPLETKDRSGYGKHTAQTTIDLRGLWYNAKTGRLEGNGYGAGLFALSLDQDGYPTGVVTMLSENIYTGYDQACAVFDGKKAVLYYDGGVVYRYSLKKNVETGRIVLKLPVDMANLNSTSMIYTGEKGYEIGLLDHVSSRVYLFDRKSGEHTATINFPDSPIMNDAFWFAYANSRVWLYDADTRAWVGYRIF
jgi:hypothetical protein